VSAARPQPEPLGGANLFIINEVHDAFEAGQRVGAPTAPGTCAAHCRGTSRERETCRCCSPS